MLTRWLNFQKSCEETMFWRNTWWKTIVSKGILSDIYLCSIVLESTKSIHLLIFFFPCRLSIVTCQSSNVLFHFKLSLVLDLPVSLWDIKSSNMKLRYRKLYEEFRPLIHTYLHELPFFLEMWVPTIRPFEWILVWLISIIRSLRRPPQREVWSLSHI